MQTRYILRTIWQDLCQRKLGTFLTILVIAASLTIPTVSYLLWKNMHNAAKAFYPEPELTLYLHKTLSEKEAEKVVQHLRQSQADKIESLTYISRQQSLEQFRLWADFSMALDLVEDNPLPAVIIFRPNKHFNSTQNMLTLRDELQKIIGIQEVRLDNGWLEKLTALTQLIARVGIVCAVLMFIAVFLVISNSIRSDVSNRRVSINVMQLLGATDHFISRPFIYLAILYGLFGSGLAMLFSLLVISYLTNVVRYVSDMFTVTFELQHFNLSEVVLISVVTIFLSWLAAKIATNRHIQKLGSRY